MSENRSRRERAVDRATNHLLTSVAVPYGAFVYVLGGWLAVGLVSVFFFLAAVVVSGWHAWREVREFDSPDRSADA